LLVKQNQTISCKYVDLGFCNILHKYNIKYYLKCPRIPSLLFNVFVSRYKNEECHRFPVSRKKILTLLIRIPDNVQSVIQFLPRFTYVTTTLQCYDTSSAVQPVQVAFWFNLLINDR